MIGSNARMAGRSNNLKYDLVVSGVESKFEGADDDASCTPLFRLFLGKEDAVVDLTALAGFDPILRDCIIGQKIQIEIAIPPTERNCAGCVSKTAEIRDRNPQSGPPLIV